jgi:hypothetical protein
MKTSTPNKLQSAVTNLDIDTNSNQSVTTFRSIDLSVAMRICADWLDTTQDVYITAILTFWDGDSHKWAIRVVYTHEPQPDNMENN